MCSFDVVSLFTNIPVERTINHILSVIDDSNLPVKADCLKELLMLACKVKFSHLLKSSLLTTNCTDK